MSSNSDKPIIAIVSNPYPENDDNSKLAFIAKDYVLWLKELGSEVIGLQWNSEKEHLKNILSKINGILIQGGDRVLRNGYYEEMLDFIIKEANKNSLPIWFTCQGFQFLHCWLLNDYSILGTYKGTRAVLLSNKIRCDNIKDSKLLKYFDIEDIKICENVQTPAFVHYNNSGVNDKLYEDNPMLRDELKIIASAKDSEGNEFLSAVESKDFSKHKYFSTQSHPEKAKYSTRKENCTEYSSIINTKLGLGFIDEVIKTQKIQTERLSKEDLEKYKVYDDFPFTLTGVTEKFYFHDGEIVMKTIDLSKLLS